MANNNYQSLIDLLNPKKEEQLFSPINPTLDQLSTPINPTPEQLASIVEQQQTPEPEIQAPVRAVAKQASPKKEEISGNPFMENVNFDAAMAKLPKEDNAVLDKNLPLSEPPISKSEALIAEYNKLLGKGETDLADARKRDRMLKIGGSIGDALATYLNARSQMNVKAPGVQVQQGAGLGKIADMFATAPEIQSDLAQRRESMMKQYAELAKGERAQTRLTSEELRAKDADLRARELAKMQIEGNLKAAGIKAEGNLKAAGIKASEKGEFTPYQQYMVNKAEKKESKLSDKQTTEIEGINNALKGLDEVEAAKTGVNTGRYASMYQSGMDILPFAESDKDFVALKQLSGTQLFDYVKAQSGVSYSVKELDQLKSNMPNVDDDDNTFMTKLKTVRGIIERKQKEKLSAFEKQGKNVGAFKEESEKTQEQPSNLVRIKGPSGQEVNMTEEKAQKYLSKPGYTRIK
jgi:hypothetical protein